MLHKRSIVVTIEKNRNQMIPYNTSEPRLILPEYGRHIQELVDHCVGIPDRDERTSCAKAIADVMATLFPEVVGDKGNRQKIWDHINIMSGFKLDIDFPCEVVSEEELAPKPKQIPYSDSLYRYRHYGRNIPAMVRKVADMENCVEKDRLIFLLANQMKKMLVVQNPENAGDGKVFSDMAEISGGRIMIDAATYRLNEYIDSTASGGQKNKKKKK